MIEASSILLVAERDDSVHQGVNRAIMLARYLNARLDILLVDATPDAFTRTAEAAEQAHRYLDALQASIRAPDINITSDAVFGLMPAEQVVAKARARRSMLVLKAAARRTEIPAGRLNWQLARSSPAPFLLTQGRPWHPRARFSAAVDLANAGDMDAPDTVLRATTSLRAACGAELDLICMQSAEATAMQRLAQHFEIEPPRSHLLIGEANHALQCLSTANAYDLVALGMPRNLSLPDFNAGPAGHLLKSLSSDMLLVPVGRPGGMRPCVTSSPARLAPSAPGRHALQREHGCGIPSGAH